MLEQRECNLQEILNEIAQSDGKLFLKPFQFFDIVVDFLNGFLDAKEISISNRDIKPKNSLVFHNYQTKQ